MMLLHLHVDLNAHYDESNRSEFCLPVKSIGSSLYKTISITAFDRQILISYLPFTLKVTELFIESRQNVLSHKDDKCAL